MGQDQSKSGLEPGGWAIHRLKSGPARPINKPTVVGELSREGAHISSGIDGTLAPVLVALLSCACRDFVSCTRVLFH